MTAVAGAVPVPASTTVLIAGGGPVGLALAMELSYHGIDCTVVERRPEVSWLRPRAKTTSARTMEHFRRWGVAAEVRKRAPLPVEWSDEVVFCTSLLGREVARARRCFGLDLTGSELVAEPGQQVPQPVIEQVLREAIAGSGRSILCTGAAIESVGESDRGTWADIVDSQGTSRRTYARYLVGCEGARSLVRRAMGARYQGSVHPSPNFNIVFRCAGLAERVPHGPAVHYWVLNPHQAGVLGRMDLQDTWWCIAQGVDAADGEANADGIVRGLIGADQPVQVLATDAWRARMLLSDRYYRGRLFIAGDAAHQNPPWGGHGFNTGIGDAVNLGWKLAAVIRGWAPERLLASYEDERRPIAARTIEEATLNMRTLAPELADPRLYGDDVRFAEARPAVAALIAQSKDSEFHSLSLTLGYNYESSPIVLTDRDSEGRDQPASNEYHPCAAPGHRLPHVWLGPGDSLYDHLGRGFSLVGDSSWPGASAAISECSSWGAPLTVVDLGHERAAQILKADLVLVRPDQHVAWRSAGTELPLGSLGRALGRASFPRPVAAL